MFSVLLPSLSLRRTLHPSAGTRRRSHVRSARLQRKGRPTSCQYTFVVQSAILILQRRRRRAGTPNSNGLQERADISPGKHTRSSAKAKRPTDRPTDEIEAKGWPENPGFISGEDAYWLG